MRVTKRQLKRIIAEESRKLRRLREDAIDSELDHLKKNIEDDIEHIRDLKDDVKDDHEEELRAEKAKREERTDESVARRKLRRQIRSMLQEEQGYDDREDERLGAEHGRVGDLDLDGDHEEEEHSRRDDAHFEDRVHVPDVHVHIHDNHNRKGNKLNESVADMADFENLIDDFAVDVSDLFQEKMFQLSKEEPDLVGSYKDFNEEAFRAAQVLESRVAQVVSDAIAELEAMLHNGDFSRER